MLLINNQILIIFQILTKKIVNTNYIIKAFILELYF